MFVTCVVQNHAILDPEEASYSYDSIGNWGQVKVDIQTNTSNPLLKY